MRFSDKTKAYVQLRAIAADGNIKDTSKTHFATWLDKVPNADKATVANGVVDSGNGKTINLNYSADAIVDPTWLAAWNGYELRGVNKNSLKVGSAIKATQDENGNNIVNTYATKDADIVIRWENPIEIGKYSRICKLSNYGTGLLALVFNQSSQASAHTYLVGTSYGNASITQLGSNGYTANYQQIIRIVQGDSPTEFNVEVYEPYGYNGATTLYLNCTYIPLTNYTACTPYKTYTPTSDSALVNAFISSQTDGMVAKTFYGNATSASTLANMSTTYNQYTDTITFS